jgi:hypothetical protein
LERDHGQERVSGRFPGGAGFAFTILDDTDDTTLENGRPIYALLRDLGFRTTKTVWPFDSPPEKRGQYFAGQTLETEGYLEWVRELAGDGFEIAFHNASMGSSPREKTIRALDVLEREFSLSSVLHCNHGENRENLYWGTRRYRTLPIAAAYAAFASRRGLPPMQGDVAASDHFWGDVARERLSYVRAFTYSTLDCSRISPFGPFFDPRKPYVRRWFNSADAPDATAFKRLVTPSSIDALARSRGWSIVSTHLGKGFYEDGRVDPEVRRTLEYLASLDGWFVPASELLDHLWAKGGGRTLGPIGRWRMEYGHVLDRARAWMRGEGTTLE